MHVYRTLGPFERSGLAEPVSDDFPVFHADLRFDAVIGLPLPGTFQTTHSIRRDSLRLE
jgi:hypothetical protein